MKKLIFALLFIPACLFADDSLSARRDLYGPAPSQWNSTTACADTTVKATSGVVHCVTVSSSPVNTWSLRDATAATGAVVISTFPASATVGTYCYDAKTNNGVQLVIPANSGPCSVTVSYR